MKKILILILFLVPITLLSQESFLYVPNSFSPNNDGVNEVWIPIGENIQQINITVINRWGDVIFETNDLLTPWNGSYRDGEYYNQRDLCTYIIRWKGVDGFSKIEYGHIHIIR
jgi:gliding motility-associated-like protein